MKVKINTRLRAYSVFYLKLTFSHFKQHNIHFHTLFHPHVSQKTTNNIIQTTLPNTPLVFVTKAYTQGNTMQLRILRCITLPLTSITYSCMVTLRLSILLFKELSLFGTDFFS